jgi:ABC-type transporter MlaC component
MTTLTSARSILTAIACIAMLAASTITASATNCPGAAIVKNAASAFLGAARNGSSSAFASALARHADIGGVALFALGKYRDELPASRRGEYFRNAHRYMSRFLASHARRFNNASAVTIESCSGGLIATATDSGSRMLWRVSGGQVQDVRISGVWLALQLRSKFTGIIRRNDGDVTALLNYLARADVAAN